MCGGAEEKLCALRKQPPAAVLQLLRGSAAVSAKCSEFLRWEDQSKHSEWLLQDVHCSHSEQPGGLSTSSALSAGPVSSRKGSSWWSLRALGSHLCFHSCSVFSRPWRSCVWSLGCCIAVWCVFRQPLPQSSLEIPGTFTLPW